MTGNIIRLIVVVVFAGAAYQHTSHFGRKYGRTPWGWSPWIWAVVCGLSLLIGLLLLVVAERTGRAQAARQDSLQR
jgi:hypothetical protein